MQDVDVLAPFWEIHDAGSHALNSSPFLQIAMLISTSLQHLAKTLPIGEVLYQVQPSRIISLSLGRILSSSGVTRTAWKLETSAITSAQLTLNNQEINDVNKSQSTMATVRFQSLEIYSYRTTIIMPSSSQHKLINRLFIASYYPPLQR